MIQLENLVHKTLVLRRSWAQEGTKSGDEVELPRDHRLGRAG